MNTDGLRSAVYYLDEAAETIANRWAKNSRDWAFVGELRGAAARARSDIMHIEHAERERAAHRQDTPGDICHKTGISGNCGPDCDAYVAGSECDA